ncbi:polysaccharide pyruvyl transferase family protein [Desulfatiferula olefinivorans]
MMEVGIVTIHDHLNYGAALQAYALNRMIRRLGHGCRTVNFTRHRSGGRLSIRAAYPGARLSRFYNAVHGRANQRFEASFRSFLHDHIPLTEQVYTGFSELSAHPPSCDALVTGSDQVWQPKLLDHDPGHVYHLGFADPQQVRLVSYAPSFGVSDIPESFKPSIVRYLHRYHHLSVREKRGRAIIAELTGRDAEHVVDPTLLLGASDYDPIIETPSLEEDYTLVYPMELGENREFLRLVKAVRKQTGRPIVCVLPLVFDFRWLLVADRVILDAGPGSFLGLVKHATLVLTNSFHGTVFSIVYRKPFLGCPHSMTPARSRDLLSDLNLSDRLIENPDDSNVAAVLHRAIPWDEVEKEREHRVGLSRAFLERALNGSRE